MLDYPITLMLLCVCVCILTAIKVERTRKRKRMEAEYHHNLTNVIIIMFEIAKLYTEAHVNGVCQAVTNRHVSNVYLRASHATLSVRVLFIGSLHSKLGDNFITT